MEFLTKLGKHDADVKHEGLLQPPTPTQRSHSPDRQSSKSPERGLLSKLIVGSGHHHSHSRPSSSSGSTIHQDHSHSQEHPHHQHAALLTALTKRETDLRHQLDLITKEKAETEGYFATLRARFDAEAEWAKNEAHAAETPGEFWEQFAAGKEMERRREGLERREREVRGELEGVERERREVERGDDGEGGGEERKDGTGTETGTGTGTGTGARECC